MEKRIKIIFLQYGLLLGMFLTALGIISYYFIIGLKNSPILFIAIPIILSLFIPIICTVLFCFNGRKRIGGYWTFKQATTGIFIMFFAAYIVQFIGKDLVFDKVIEPNSIQKTQDAAINAKTANLVQGGNSKSAIDKEIAEMKKDFAQQQTVTIGSIIQGTIISILFIFIIALIFGSLFKKDPPVYAS